VCIMVDRKADGGQIFQGTHAARGFFCERVVVIKKKCDLRMCGTLESNLRRCRTSHRYR